MSPFPRVGRGWATARDGEPGTRTRIIRGRAKKRQRRGGSDGYARPGCPDGGLEPRGDTAASSAGRLTLFCCLPRTALPPPAASRSRCSPFPRGVVAVHRVRSPFFVNKIESRFETAPSPLVSLHPTRIRITIDRSRIEIVDENRIRTDRADDAPITKFQVGVEISPRSRKRQRDRDRERFCVNRRDSRRVVQRLKSLKPQRSESVARRDDFA